MASDARPAPAAVSRRRLAPDPSHRRPLRTVAVVLGVMALGIAAVWFMPALPAARGMANYLPLHILLETISIVIAALVFAVGWNSHSRELPSNVILLGSAFVYVAAVDFSHTLSYAGMPAFVTPSGPEKAINFWLAGRLAAALALLVAAVLPWRPFASWRTRYLLLAGAVVLAGLTHWLVLWDPEVLPHTFVPGVGLTSFKIGAEYVVIAIAIAAAAVLWRHMRRPLEYNAPALFGAVVAMAMSEYLFTLYADVTDLFNLMGHVYKAISYVFLYKAIVVSTVERPYRALRASEETLQATLDALPDLLFELDLDGRLYDVNEPAAALLAVTPDDLVSGTTVRDVLDADAADVVMGALREARDTGSCRGRQYLLQGAHGRHWFELSVARKAPGPDGAAHYVALSHDIDQRKAAESALADSRNLLQTVIDTAPVRIFWKDLDLRYLGCNPAFAQDAGLRGPQEVIGKDEFALGWRDQAEAYRADDRRVLETGAALLSYDEPQTTPDGRTVWLRTSKVPLRDSTGATSGLLGVYEDITDRKQAELALQRSETALSTAQAVAQVGSWTYDPASRTLEGSAQGRRMFGIEGAGPVPLEVAVQAIHPDDRDMVLTAAGSGHSFDLEFRLVVGGDLRWVHTRVKVETDESGRLLTAFGTTQDVTDRKAFEDRVYTLAHFDPLTGLPNRAQLHDLLAGAVEDAARDGGVISLMFIDLDHFKDVNDTLGHSVGDELLVQLASRVRGTLPAEAVVCRLGGDEFIVMLPDADSSAAAVVAQRLLDVIARPYQVEEYDLSLTASIGIAVYPQDGADREALSRSADTAMYRAKQDGRSCFRFFSPQMQERSARNLRLVNDLRHALERGQLSVVYQPQLTIDGSRLVGVEALARWQHPDLGAVTPSEFIPVAEDSGLIIPIGEWVLRTAVRQLQAWMRVGIAPMRMAVNLSAVQLRHASLLSTVTRVLAEEGLDPDLLELELTEGVAMHDPQAAIAALNDLSAHGVRLSLDDFGTGYSSLSYLKQFKVYKLKIDRSFVADIGSDPEDQAIVSTIVHIARNLGLRTIAEGVETAEELAFMRGQGCDEVQGYYFARPLPPAGLVEFARSREVAPRR